MSQRSALDRLFMPESVAIVGASGREDNPFARPLQYLINLGFEGQILPINPGYEEIFGVRCYPSLSDTGVVPDLVLVLVPAKAVMDVIKEAGKMGAGAAILFSSGFAEVGEEGRNVQKSLAAIARKTGTRIIGPNCQGVVYQPTKLVATFTGAIGAGLPESTGVAYVGQSGAVGGSILDLSRERGLGMTAWVSLGNQADLTVSEVALDLVERKEIEVIALYLESLEQGADYLNLAQRAAELDKRLVVLRSGRTEVGRRATASHTGALLAPGAHFEALSKRLGIVLVDDVDELLDASFVMSRLGRGHGRRTAIVTSSGGAGAIAADHLAEAGLEIPEMPQALQAELSKVIPDFGAVENPIDVTAQLFSRGVGAFGEVCRAVAEEPSVDQVAVVLTMVTGESASAIARDVANVIDTTGIPVHLCWLAGREQTVEARKLLRGFRIPVHESVRRLAAAVSWAATPNPELLGNASSNGPVIHPAKFSSEVLTEAELTPLLRAAGVPTPNSVLIVAPEDAPDAVLSVGGVAVLKGQSASALHKSEMGLVRLNVGPDDAKAAAGDMFERMAGHGSLGLLVQEQIMGGIELLVGVTSGVPGLPHLLTVGMGGVQTELLGDVVSDCLPIDRQRVSAMLRRLKMFPLLDGFRGGPVYDIESAVDAVLGIAQLAASFGDDLHEMEINPLIVCEGKSGAFVADGLVRLKKNNSE